jgi:hypothetical protein
MVHLVLAYRNGGYFTDSAFTAYDPIPEPEEGFAYGEDTVRLVKNPVRVLEQLWGNPRIKGIAREVWCEHWVLDCNTGKIVLDNDWSERSITKALALKQVTKGKK